MTTFGQEMRELAQDLTEEFSEELGMSELHHIIGTDYDTETGEHTVQYSKHQAYAAFEDIDIREVSDESYVNDHRKCTIAGDDISITPIMNDLVVDTDGELHRIDKVTTDQYKAAYIIHFERKVVADGP